jgi:hypothetical protein
MKILFKFVSALVMLLSVGYSNVAMAGPLDGKKILVIGDSHLADTPYLGTTLHDPLLAAGAEVYTFGACGSVPSIWVGPAKGTNCNSGFRLNKGPFRKRVTDSFQTTPLLKLVEQYHVDMVVLIYGDTMSGFKEAVMPTPWVSREVRSLVDEVKKTGVRCVWVGPTWGDNETQDGAKNSFKKTYARTEQMSNFLSDNVAPCIYIDSQKMWGKGEVPTHDGQHMTNEGYVKWGSAIAEQILLQYKK